MTDLKDTGSNPAFMREIKAVRLRAHEHPAFANASMEPLKGGEQVWPRQ